MATAILLIQLKINDTRCTPANKHRPSASLLPCPPPPPAGGEGISSRACSLLLYLGGELLNRSLSPVNHINSKHSYL